MSAKGLGIGAAGMAAGWLIFPPLAIVAGVVGNFTKLGGIDGWGKRKKRIDASLLRSQLISPGTNISGLVFIPAVKNQTGLITMYEVDGRAESLSIVRTAQ